MSKLPIILYETLFHKDILIFKHLTWNDYGAVVVMIVWWLDLQLPIYIYVYVYINIYVWKLNQTVLELDFRAVKYLFFPRRDLNPHHWYTAAPFA